MRRVVYVTIFAWTTLVTGVCPATALGFADANYVVTTLAGAGTSGIRDGDAATAEFVKPVGIAIDDHSNVYVADAAAQRIRVVSPTGFVKTLAGSGRPEFGNMWVLGGYKDGPALQARFNRPSGVAVAADGSVYVADTLNHCIRLIANGMVSTFAGSPGNTSAADGPVAQASFIRPRALAFDSRGDLYVADYPLGIRKISHGIVSSIPLNFGADKRFLSISFLQSTQRLFVGTANELVSFDDAGRTLFRLAVAGGTPLYGMRSTLQTNTVSKAQALGPPFGIVPLADGSVVVSDARAHAVRVLRDPASALVTFPTLIPDAGDFGGGYQDGPLETALFDSPMGLAQFPDGSIAVADSGNRRIRKLSPTTADTQARLDTPWLDLAPKEQPQGGEVVAGEDPFPGMSDHNYRIAFIGNSFAFFNTRWADSVPGRIEAGLRSRWRELGFAKPPKIVSISPIKDLAGMRSYVDGILSLGVVDAVILQINEGNIGESFPAPKTENVDWPSYNARWEAPVSQLLRHAERTLSRSGVRLVVVATPSGPHLTSNELQVASEVLGFEDWPYLLHGPPSGDDYETRMQHLLARSGLYTIDLFPAFLEAEQAARRLPLFGTVDGHFSHAGRALAAKTILEYFLATPFWKSKARPTSKRHRAA